MPTSRQLLVLAAALSVFGHLEPIIAVSNTDTEHNANSTGNNETGFVALFDGKTLKGFEGNDQIWSAQDGMIVGKSPGISHNDFLSTKQRFKDFELRTEFRLVNGIGNSGIQFRSERVPDSTEVSGYQADLGQMFWGSLYDESRRNKILNCPDPKATAKALVQMFGPSFTMEIEDKTPSPDLEELNASLDKEGWNRFSIRAVGNRIVLRINGHITAQYTEKEQRYVKAGIIAFQVHSGPPCEVQFRNIRIKEIADSQNGGR